MNHAFDSVGRVPAVERADMQGQEKKEDSLIREIRELRDRIAELNRLAVAQRMTEQALAQSLEKLRKATGIVIDVIPVACRIGVRLASDGPDARPAHQSSIIL